MMRNIFLKNRSEAFYNYSAIIQKPFMFRKHLMDSSSSSRIIK
jgi:hypothetical protein